jgi:hypothetical protein
LQNPFCLNSRKYKGNSKRFYLFSAQPIVFLVHKAKWPNQPTSSSSPSFHIEWKSPPPLPASPAVALADEFLYRSPPLPAMAAPLASLFPA